MRKMLEVKALDFYYPKSSIKVLDNVALVLEEGRFTALVGPNGSGKSTLFRCMSGELIPKTGGVWLNDQPVQNYTAAKRSQKLAIVHQKNMPIVGMTVQEVVALGRTPYQKLLGQPTSADQQAIEQALEQTGLQELRDRFLENLSGGQQQRVWLAVALAQEPDIILLDEPMTYLDVYYQLDLLNRLQELIRVKGLTVCAILHDLNQVLAYADQVYLLNQGKLVTAGYPPEVLNQKIMQEVFNIQSEQVINSRNQVLLDLYLEVEGC